MLRGMTIANLTVLSFAVTAPAVHVLSLPNMFALDRPLRRIAEHDLFAAWCGAFGALVVLALLTTLALVFWRRAHSTAFRASSLAAFAYGAICVALFAIYVSAQFTQSDEGSGVLWRWQAAHLMALALAIVGWLALLRASFSARWLG